MRSRKMVKVSSADRDSLLKTAFLKYAGDDDGKNRDLNNTGIGALLGALAGTGLGYLNYKITPKDKDEDKKKKLLTHLLGGAGLGAVAGAGLGYWRVPSRVAEGVKSLFTSDPLTNEQIAKEVTDDIVSSEPVNAAVYGAGGWMGGKAIGMTSDLAHDQPWVAARLTRGRTFTDNRGHDIGGWGTRADRTRTLQEMRAGTWNMNTTLGEISQVRHGSMQIPVHGAGRIHGIPRGATMRVDMNVSGLSAAQRSLQNNSIKDFMLRRGLVDRHTPPADAWNKFVEGVRLTDTLESRNRNDPSMVQQFFGSRGAHKHWGPGVMAAIGAFIGYMRGGDSTSTPINNSESRSGNRARAAAMRR